MKKMEELRKNRKRGSERNVCVNERENEGQIKVNWKEILEETEKAGSQAHASISEFKILYGLMANVSTWQPARTQSPASDPPDLKQKVKRPQKAFPDEKKPFSFITVWFICL